MQSAFRTPRFRAAASLGVALFLTATIAPPARSDDAAFAVQPDVAARDWSRQHLRLLDGDILRLDLPAEPGVAFSVGVPIEGVEFMLDLFPHSVRAEGYQLLAQIEDGSLVPVEPGPERTMRGVVRDRPGSVVAASLFDEGLQARIILDDDRSYWIEPLAGRMPGASRDVHVVYRGEDVIPSGGTCGLDETRLPPAPEGGAGPDGGGCGSLYCVAQLACDADFEYYSIWGSNVTNVQNRINSVINSVNVQYDRDVAIRHLITTIIVRTAEPDPYSSTNPGTLLDQFRNQWLANHGNVVRDLAHLFTGKNLSGSVIGIAYNIGVVCTSQAYCLAQSDCCGSFACATDLTAHELGHLWGGFHCSCSSGGSAETMNPSLLCVNRFLAQFSIPSIVAHRNSRTCLSPGLDPDPPTPNPMEWTTVPTPSTSTSLAMQAAAGSDISPPVEYEFSFVSGGAGGTSSGWQTNRVYFDSGLTPNTIYNYRCRARDSFVPPNVGQYSTTEGTATFIETPAGLTAGAVTANSVELNAVGPFTNLAVGQSGLYFHSTTPGGTGGIAEWVQSTTDTATGLQPDTTYTFYVKARNQNGAETQFGPPLMVTTLPGTGGVRGDCDGNGMLEFNGDGPCFVNALLGIDTSPPGGIARSDLNNDGRTDGLDIDLFVGCILLGCP